MLKNTLAAPLFILLALVVAGCGDRAPAKAADAPPSYAEVIAASEHYPGLLDFYRDRESGELYLDIGPEQLGREYIYAAKFLDGLAQTWTSRGVHSRDVILTLERHFKRLEFLQVNDNYYFDPAMAIARAADANRQPGLLAVAEIVAEEADSGRFLAKMNPVFLSETLTPITPPVDPEAQPGESFKLGPLSAEKSSVEDVRAYPRNSQVTVRYVFEDPAPLVAPSPSFVDPRIVPVVLQHSFLAMPDDGFAPRFADPRVGYFTNEVDDKTSFSATPWRDPITRWRLQKKDPQAALSEPVQPIVFWLENTTPVQFRDEVMAGVLAWNAAFEQAGFRNAIEVRVQPDDADWDAEDMRYNVLRWTASDESPWGGYGPTFSNPRTGEIVASDIMLEFSWLTVYNRWDSLFIDRQLAGMRERACTLGAERSRQLALASLVSSGTFDPKSELVRQSVIDLVMHEVGHTLGLNHNFIASHYLTPEQLRDASVTQAEGLSSSVMDYMPPNLAPPGESQADFFAQRVGIYDRWAIEYGYSPALEDAEQETARLQNILARSTEPGHALAVDAESMDDSATGLDPRVLTFDMSSDPIRAGRDSIGLMYATAAGAIDRLARDGATWQEVHDSYTRLTGEIGRQGQIASRWIGGVFSDKAVQGQQGAQAPLTPVPLAQQQAAMQLLGEDIFAPQAFSFSAEFYQHLQRTRRAQNFDAQPQTPPLHKVILSHQKRALDHLLHPVVMERIADSALYGNAYTLTDMLTALTAAVFAADVKTSVNSRRQQLQGEYLRQLLAISAENSTTGHNQVARSAALGQLQGIRALLKGRSRADAATNAHTAALLLDIRRSLEP